jgi:hypothetical protein
MDGSLVSPNGSIQVRSTGRGLPITLELDPRELSKAPSQLAPENLLQCQVSAIRAQVARRRRGLSARGVSPAIIRGLNLRPRGRVGKC